METAEMPADLRPCERDDCPFHKEDWERRFSDLETTAQRTQTMLQWGIGLMVGIALSIGGLVYSGVDGRLKALEGNGSAPLRERVSRMEATVDAIQGSLAEIKVSQKEILKRLETR